MIAHTTPIPDPPSDVNEKSTAEDGAKALHIYVEKTRITLADELGYDPESFSKFIKSNKQVNEALLSDLASYMDTVSNLQSKIRQLRSACEKYLEWHKEVSDSREDNSEKFMQRVKLLDEAKKLAEDALKD